MAPRSNRIRAATVRERFSARFSPARALTVAALLCALGYAAGCRSTGHDLTITSYEDPYFPETYTLTLDSCTYHIDGAGDYRIAGHSAATFDGSDDTVDQYLCLRLFRRPHPGKTGDDSTSINATIRLAIVTPAGVAVYSGTAYVYPSKARIGSSLKLDIESARLRLETAVGDAPALLGDAKLVGRIVARHDSGRAIETSNEVARLAALRDWAVAED